jgi:hypothetical protein
MYNALIIRCNMFHFEYISQKIILIIEQSVAAGVHSPLDPHVTIWDVLGLPSLERSCHQYPASHFSAARVLYGSAEELLNVALSKCQLLLAVCL